MSTPCNPTGTPRICALPLPSCSFSQVARCRPSPGCCCLCSPANNQSVGRLEWRMLFGSDGPSIQQSVAVGHFLVAVFEPAEKIRRGVIIGARIRGNGRLRRCISSFVRSTVVPDDDAGNGAATDRTTDMWSLCNTARRKKRDEGGSGSDHGNIYSTLLPPLPQHLADRPRPRPVARRDPQNKVKLQR